MKRLAMLMIVFLLVGCGTGLKASCVGHSALCAYQAAGVKVSDDGVLKTDRPTRIVFGPALDRMSWHAQADVLADGKWVPLSYDERTGEVFYGGRDAGFQPQYYLPIGGPETQLMDAWE